MSTGHSEGKRESAQPDRRLELGHYSCLEPVPPFGIAQQCWRAVHEPSGRHVVVVLLGPLPGGALAAERFLLGLQRVMDLRHPLLSPITDAAVKDDQPFIVYDVPATFRALPAHCARSAPLSERDALSLVADLADALEHVESQTGLCHGALVPHAIWLQDNGRAWLLGTSIVPLVVNAVAATVGGADLVRLVTRYAAPEIALGAQRPDRPADLYALGGILYELLTGISPFADSTDLEAMFRQSTGFLEDPRKYQRGLSSGCLALVEWLLRKEPLARPSSWAELRHAVAALMENGKVDIPAPPPGVVSTLQRDPAIETPRTRLSTLVERSAKLLSPRLRPSAGRRPRGIIRQRSKPRALSAGAYRGNGPRRRPAELSRTPFYVTLVLVGSLVGYLGWRHVFTAPSEPNDRTDDLPQRPGLWEHVRSVGAASSGKPEPIAPSSDAPRRISVVEEQKAPDPSGESAAGEEVLLAPSGPSRAAHPRFRHADFVTGARAFNEALTLFKQYEKDRNATVLPRAERLAEEAIRSFEAYQKAASEDKDARRYLEQAYGLLRYVRQAMLMTGIQSEPARPRHRSAAPAPSASRGLRLASGWNVPRGDADVLGSQLYHLLRSWGTPAFNPTPQPDLHLTEGIFYLMPARDFLRSLGASLPAPRLLSGLAFPERSFKAYALTASADPGYAETVLLTDLDDAIISVQLVDRRPRDELSLPRDLFSDRWLVVDFVTGQFRDTKTQRVAHRVTRAGRVLHIETELAESDPSEPELLKRSLYRSKWIIPQPIVDVLLFRLYATQRSVTTEVRP